MDPRLASALAIQLRDWRIALRSGAERVGWKLGMGESERIGPGPVIGHLTSATRLDSGGVYRTEGAVALHADAEIALALGEDAERASWPPTSSTGPTHSVRWTAPCPQRA